MLRVNALLTFITIAALYAPTIAAEKDVDSIPQLQSVEVETLEREVIVDRYPNGQPKAEREVALDHDENFVNHGVMRLYNDRGTFIGGGTYEWGRRTGKWTRIYNSANDAPLLNQVGLQGFKAPFVSEADFSDDQLDGAWIIRDAEDKPIVQWGFVNGRRGGHWTWYNARGDVRQQINFRDGYIVGDIVAMQAGQKQPQVIQRYIDGRRLVSDSENYENGRPRKQGFLLMPKEKTSVRADWWAGIVEEATMRTEGQPMRHGEHRYWYPDGRPQMVGTYNVGKETGNFVWFYDNGDKQTEGAYVSGRRDGEWKEWFPNGQLKGAGMYANGLRSGKWRTWFDNGMRQRDAEFRGGQQVGSLRIWDRNGARINEDTQEEIAEKTDDEVVL